MAVKACIFFKQGDFSCLLNLYCPGEQIIHICCELKSEKLVGVKRGETYMNGWYIEWKVFCPAVEKEIVNPGRFNPEKVQVPIVQNAVWT